MKSKIVSLKNNKEFISLLKGKKITNRYSTIFFKKLSGKNTSKLNISFVTKKKIGNAVIRNKIKRRLRNIMNEMVKKKNINLNFSYLLIAKKEIYQHNYDDIKKNLMTNLNKN